MGWDEEAQGWDENPGVQAYAGAAFRAIREQMDAVGADLRAARVLDFGCGTGLLTASLAQHAVEVVGLDLSVPMIEGLRKKGLANVEALSGRIEDHELGHFDLITCSSVLAFVDDYPGTVQALVHLLEPGAWFLQFDWELDAAAEEPFGLSRDQIQQALTDAGLTNIVVRTGFQEAFEGHEMAPVLGVGQRPRS